MRYLVKSLSAAVLASAVLAQNIFVDQPTANTKVVAGSRITVKLDRPMSLTGSEEVAVVIGIISCMSASACPDVSVELGEVVYNGPYAPELFAHALNPYQNFTVTVPLGYRGPIQLGVAHFFLLAAGPSGQLQFTTTPLDVVASG